MIHRFLHIIISLTLLLSTSGVTVTAYFCQDNLSGLSLFSPKECKSSVKACCLKSKGKKKCCTSDSEFFKIDIDQQLSKISDYTDIDFDDINVPVATQENDKPINFAVAQAYLYRPPPLIKDRSTLYQVFLC